MRYLPGVTQNVLEFFKIAKRPLFLVGDDFHKAHEVVGIVPVSPVDPNYVAVHRVELPQAEISSPSADIIRELYPQMTHIFFIHDGQVKKGTRGLNERLEDGIAFQASEKALREGAPFLLSRADAGRLKI